MAGSLLTTRDSTRDIALNVAVRPDRPGPLLSVSGLSVSYGRVRALDDIHLDVRSGELVALAGENGAGKTTLVRCIAGDVVPAAGEIFLAGKRVPPDPAGAAKLLAVPERVEMLREVTSRWSGVEVDVFDGLLVDYARKRGAGVILRGIRAVSDYEYELQMALMNRRLRPEIETVFLMASEAHSFISSRLVKEVIRLGGNIGGLVPPSIEGRLKRRLLEETGEA